MNTFWKCYLFPRSAAFFIKSFLVRAIFTVHFSAECTAMERSPFSSMIQNSSILKPRPHLSSANELRYPKHFLQFLSAISSSPLIWLFCNPLHYDALQVIHQWFSCDKPTVECRFYAIYQLFFSGFALRFSLLAISCHRIGGFRSSGTAVSPLKNIQKPHSRVEWSQCAGAAEPSCRTAQPAGDEKKWEPREELLVSSEALSPSFIESLHHSHAYYAHIMLILCA